MRLTSQRSVGNGPGSVAESFGARLHIVMLAALFSVLRNVIKKHLRSH